jgi:hypothetical protein
VGYSRVHSSQLGRQRTQKNELGQDAEGGIMLLDEVRALEKCLVAEIKLALGCVRFSSRLGGDVNCARMLTEKHHVAGRGESICFFCVAWSMSCLGAKYTTRTGSRLHQVAAVNCGGSVH